LIFHGTDDVIVPPSYSEEYVAAHPNAKLYILKSDHQLTDSTDTIWAEVREFI
jgi:pimeloyl-ACP methyl ester carboxylesterase